MRQITEAQARAVAAILSQECGWHADERSVYSFVHSVTRDCREWRFIGALGFGGKFRNNGNRDNTPYVDCYPEDSTPERKAMIERANARLDELFATEVVDGV